MGAGSFVVESSGVGSSGSVPSVGSSGSVPWVGASGSVTSVGSSGSVTSVESSGSVAPSVFADAVPVTAISCVSVPSTRSEVSVPSVTASVVGSSVTASVGGFVGVSVGFSALPPSHATRDVTHTSARMHASTILTFFIVCLLFVSRHHASAHRLSPQLNGTKTSPLKINVHTC